MKQKEIAFNYFYKIFVDKYYQKISEWEQKENVISTEIFYFENRTMIPKEEQLSIYQQCLFDICVEYVALSDAPIDILPKDPFSFIELILNTLHENPYQHSFLQSLQFIYQEYLSCLGKGWPLLMMSIDTTLEPSLEVVLDSHYKINSFVFSNMELIERDQILNKMISMENRNQIGPVPKVHFLIRKDI